MLGHLKSLAANIRKTQSSTQPLALDLALLPAAAVASAIAAYLVIQRSTYRSLLDLGHNPLAGDETWALPLAALAANLGVILPALLLGVAFRLFRLKRWLTGYCSVLAVALYWLLFDLVLYQSIGRHLSTTLSFALLPQGRAAAGDLGLWAWNATLWLIASAVLSFGLVLGLRFVLLQVLRRARSAMLGVIAGAKWILLLGILVAGPLAQNAWTHLALRERLHGMFAIDPRIWSPIPSSDAASTETRLQKALSVSYRNFFPLIFAAKPIQVEPPETTPSPLPNVVLIVTESLRNDVFTPELMPRLFGWAQGGTIFEDHYATAPYSETAMFSLLYGRSPLVYHSTLDSRISPPLFAELRALGYECAFFTGHPKIWMRREEFLNEGTLDQYVHDDVGSWPDWDKKALDRAVNLANAPGRTKPIFALVLLMSTHFEYRYPPEYERHVPVANSIWPLTRISALGPEARTPHWNRYQNSVAFVDDLVADTVAKLDPAHNVVIFTGDHGESVGDDGRFGHGYSFSDKITRVPFVIVGGPFGKRQIPELSSHLDLLPTLLPALGGRAPKHTHGIDLLSPHAPRERLLLAHAAVERRQADALLLDHNLRLRMQLDLREPQITVQGLEDELGRLLPSQALSSGAEAELVAAFQDELDRIRQ